jgi:methyl-accepting chemotaxis protein
MTRRTTAHELKSFGIHLMGASLAFALVLALGVGAVTLGRWAVSLELASSSPQKVYEATGRILELHERFWPVLLVSMLGVVIAASWLGRRITGPLVRFTNVFQRLAAGEFPEPVTPRATDYLALEAEALNQLVSALKARSAERARLQGEVMATLDEMSDRIRQHATADVKELAERALEQMKALHGSSS